MDDMMLIGAAVFATAAFFLAGFALFALFGVDRRLGRIERYIAVPEGEDV